MKHFIICCISVIFVFFAHFLGISILFHLSGAFYQTVGSLLLFTLCYTGLTFVLEPAEKVLIHSMKLLGINRRITVFAAENDHDRMFMGRHLYRGRIAGRRSADNLGGNHDCRFVFYN